MSVCDRTAGDGERGLNYFVFDGGSTPEIEVWPGRERRLSGFLFGSFKEPTRYFGWHSTPSIDGAMRITSATYTGSALRAAGASCAAT